MEREITTKTETGKELIEKTKPIIKKKDMID